MTYPTNIDIVNLNEFGVDKFKNILLQLSTECADKNRDWFDPDNNWSLIHQFAKYDWCFALHDDQLVAFSAIQKYNFGVRVLTRTFYMPVFRKSSLKVNMKYTMDEITPAMKMLQYQLNSLKNSDVSLAFISMEYPERRTALETFRDKLNHHYDNNWTIPENMYLTCPDPESFSCWQNICYTELKPNSFFNDWGNITVDEWRNRYGNARKTLD